MPYDQHRAEAAIMLGDRPVGELRYQGRKTEFEYTDLDPLHPVFGQSFEADPIKRRRGRNGVPTWFANLLPEPGSGLRALLEADMGQQGVHDFRLLVHIGEDLPGAVRVVSGKGCDDVPADDRAPADGAAAQPAGGLRFSLAGVQRKLSMLRRGNSITVPARGESGDVLVKFQDADLPQLPENEFSMMQWARLAGIACATTALRPRSDLHGLPERLWASSETVLAVDRFDRLPGGGRVHQEDIAQAWDVRPDRKYLDSEDQPVVREDGNVRLGRDIARLCPVEDLAEYVRRLAASVLMGNADMHLKNWSLVYPNGRDTRLSPAYDLVCVTAYPRFDERLAFPIGGEWAADKIGVDHFRRLGDLIGQDADRIAAIASETATRMTEAWPTVKREYPVPDFVTRHIDERLAKHPLLAG